MRRKITMLFVALLACVGVAKADVTDLPRISTVENPIYYTIMNTRSSQPGGLMYWAGDNVGMKDEQAIVLEAKHKFFFTGSHDAMYVHNAATGKKLATIGNGNNAAGSWTDEGTEWAVGVSPRGGGLAFGPKGGLNGNACWNECNYATQADKPDFTTWSANDDGSIFIVDLAEDYVFPMTDLFYVIESPLFEKVQGVKKAICVNAEGKAVWGTEDLTNHNFYWIPTVDAEGKTVALKNLGTGTYLSKADGTMTTEAATATLKILGDCSFNINIGGTLHAAGHDNGKGGNGSLTSWGGSIGSASAWRFVQKNDPTALKEVVVNYSFTYGGEEKYTQTSNTFVDEEYPAFTIELPFGVSAEKPKGVISAKDATGGTITKVIELTVNLPFTYAADYASIENWYYIQMHSSPGYGKYLQDAATYIEWADATVDATAKDTYTWGFVGNPFDGFMLVNYGAGKDKAVNSNGAGNPALGDYATGTKWAIKASAVNKDSEHFCFQYPGSNQYMNAQSGKVAFWHAADQGSTMWVTLRDDSKSLKALIETTEASLTAWNQTGVGYVTVSAEDRAAISEALATAKAAIENKTGYDAAEAALNAAISAAKPYTIQPEAGKFYTIVNAHTDHRGGQSIYVNKDGGMQFAKTGEVASEIARVFQFVTASDGKFYLGNIENGTYLSTAKGHGGGQNQALATLTNNAVAVTITNMGKDNQVKIVPDGGAMIHAQNAGSQVVGWDANNVDDASAWKIVETELSLNDLTHTLTVSEAGWATLVLGYNAEIPTGVKAYTVSAVNAGSTTLAEVKNVLPAHTPVLVEATTGEYVFKYTSATAANVEKNLLVGSVFNIKVEGLGYVLTNATEGVGFYKTELTDGKFTSKANEAYLEIGNEEETKEFFSIKGKKIYALTFVVDNEIYRVDSLSYGEAIVIPEAPVKEGHTFSGWSEAPETMPAADVTISGTFTTNEYLVTFKIGEEVIAADSLEYGATIVAPEAPEKEGYTFDGWGEVAETVPAGDVIYEGSYSVNSYLLTYTVNGDTIQTDSVAYGTVIALIEEPVKEGHTFSGWNEAPETMPAGDVTISGTFTANEYLVTFKIGDEVIAADSLEYGAAIVVPEAPEKEGYTFDGWGEVAETVPASDVTYEGSYSVNSYLLTYTVDGDTIQADSVAYGTVIALIEEPVKEGYTFSGWSEAPETMPAADVTISGTFIINEYLVTFKIGDEIIAADSLEYGAAIVAPEAPEKEGYTFDGWGEVAETMPAGDVTYEGSYSVNSYLLTYTVDGDTIQADSVAYGTVIALIEEPVKEGHTFSGWSEAPEIMPAGDVTISGTFTINEYLVTFKIGDEVIAADSLEYGAAIVAPEAPEKEGYTFDGWGEVAETVPAGDVTYEGSYTVNIYKVYYYVGDELVHTEEVAYGEAMPEYVYEPTTEGDVFMGWVGETYDTMPAHDVTYTANIESGIDQSTIDNSQLTIYDLNGRRVVNIEHIKGGIYIVNGKKVMIK